MNTLSASSDIRLLATALDVCIEGLNPLITVANEHALISITDVKGNITYVNDKFCALSGYSREELIGQNHNIIKSDEHPKEMFVELWKTIANGNPWHGVIKNIKKNGDIYWVKSTIAPDLNAQGKPQRYVSFRTEITEQKNLEQRLLQAQRMEAVGQLTGGIAHDFNNLLGVILGNAEMVEDRVQGDEIAKGRIEALLTAVKRGAALTYRLLAFSRQQRLSPTTVDINDLIFSLEDMLHRTLGETVDLRVKATPGLWGAVIDTSQLENALVNLAVNARDAMPKGGTLTIETANVTLDEAYAEEHIEVTPGDYVMVAVSDSGTGMPPEVLEKVFEPFFTTKGMGKGTGLGLSMVYGFVKQSKGHITVYSEIDHGTTVKLYMIRTEEYAPKESTKEDTQELALGTERILIVEDDESLREVPVFFLQDQGYEVVEAENGKEAIKLLKDDSPFDLLFTDIVLPGGMNGVEIAEQAKQIQPNIKFLYTTGYTENAIIHQGQLGAGANLINKPYQRAELLERVRKVLDNKDD
jgi:PAS domain S-box-containing protein